MQVSPELFVRDAISPLASSMNRAIFADVSASRVRAPRRTHHGIATRAGLWANITARAVAIYSRLDIRVRRRDEKPTRESAAPECYSLTEAYVDVGARTLRWDYRYTQRRLDFPIAPCGAARAFQGLGG